MVSILQDYDAKLQLIHEDNERAVKEYHENMHSIEMKMTELKDAIDREYMPKFKEEEDRYQKLTKDLQAAYNEVFYARGDIEQEYYRLINEQEEYKKSGRTDEL